MTAFLQVKNDAVSTLAADITDIATSLSVAAGDGAKFPQPGDGFHITIDNEILKCTARTDDALTVTRAQEGTTAAAHGAGTAVRLNITAKLISDLNDEVAAHRSFVKGWTSDKFLKGAGAGADPTEVSKSVFEFIGADEIDIKGLYFGRLIGVFYKVWTDLNLFTAGVSGSGVAVTAHYPGLRFETGTTSGSASYLQRNNADYSNDADANSLLLSALIFGGSDLSASTVWLGFFLTNNADPADTSNHWGIKIINGTIYASCGNGTAGTQENTGVTIGLNVTRRLLMIRSSAGYKLYIDGVLKATLTTNLPASWVYFVMRVKNNEAVNKVIDLSPISTLQPWVT